MKHLLLALFACVMAVGQTVPTPLPGDPLRIPPQGSITPAAVTGARICTISSSSATAYVGATSPAMSTYPTGVEVRFTANQTSGAAPTLNCGGGAMAIRDALASAAIPTGFMESGYVYTVRSNGTYWLMQEPAPGATGQKFLTNVNAGATISADNLPVSVTSPPYSAVGDGVADDTAAIQAAIDANPAGNILLPCGSYKISQITISATLTSLLRPRFAFLGASSKCVTLLPSGAGPAIVFGAVDGNHRAVFLTGGYSLYSASATSEIAIQAYNPWYTDFDDIAINGANQAGFTVAGIKLTCSTPSNCSNVNFRTVTIHSIKGHGLYSTGNGGFVKLVTAPTFTAESNGGVGIFLDTTSATFEPCTACEIAGNLESNTVADIQASGDIHIKGAYLEDPADAVRSPILIKAGTGGGGSSARITIEDCVFGGGSNTYLIEVHSSIVSTNIPSMIRVTGNTLNSLLTTTIPVKLPVLGGASLVPHARLEITNNRTSGNCCAPISEAHGWVVVADESYLQPAQRRAQQSWTTFDFTPLSFGSSISSLRGPWTMDNGINVFAAPNLLFDAVYYATNVTGWTVTGTGAAITAETTPAHGLHGAYLKLLCPDGTNGCRFITTAANAAQLVSGRRYRLTGRYAYSGGTGSWFLRVGGTAVRLFSFYSVMREVDVAQNLGVEFVAPGDGYLEVFISNATRTLEMEGLYLQDITAGSPSLRGYVDAYGAFSGTTFRTTANCSSSASPAVCGSAAAGSVVVAASAMAVVVNTTAVTANSQIIVTWDSSLGTKLSVTCNTTPTLAAVTARTAATSFTITTSAPDTNPACFSYSIIN